MEMKKNAAVRTIVFAVFVIVLHVIVVFASVKGYEIYQSTAETRRLRDNIKAGNVENEDELAGIIYSYDVEYGMKNGDNKKYSGSEVYYWNGKKLTSASDFMKGYDD